MYDDLVIILSRISATIFIIAYVGWGVMCYVSLKDKFKHTRYDVIWFLLFLPITGTLWLLGKIHDFMKKEI